MANPDLTQVHFQLEAYADMVSLEFSCGEWYMVSLARILEGRHDHHVTGVVNDTEHSKCGRTTLTQRVAHVRSYL